MATALRAIARWIVNTSYTRLELEEIVAADEQAEYHKKRRGAAYAIYDYVYDHRMGNGYTPDYLQVLESIAASDIRAATALKRIREQDAAMWKAQVEDTAGKLTRLLDEADVSDEVGADMLLGVRIQFA